MHCLYGHIKRQIIISSQHIPESSFWLPAGISFRELRGQAWSACNLVLEAAEGHIKTILLTVREATLLNDSSSAYLSLRSTSGTGQSANSQSANPPIPVQGWVESASWMIRRSTLHICGALEPAQVGSALSPLHQEGTKVTETLHEQRHPP